MPILFQQPKQAKEVSQADKEAYRRKQEEEFAKQPRWKRLLTEIPYGVGKGLMGTPPDATWSGAGDTDKANIITQGIMAAAPILGMTKYLSVNRTPHVEARKLATSNFLKESDKFGPEVSDAAARFANKYPRIAAHMSPRPMTQQMIDANQLGSVSPHEAFTESYKRTVPINIHPGSSNPNIKLHSPINTMAHEGTHVAQILGKGKQDMIDLYEGFHKGVGYRNNPFEKTARDIGKKFQDHQALEDVGVASRDIPMKVRNVNTEMKNVISNPPPIGSASREHFEKVLKTLVNRRMRINNAP